MSGFAITRGVGWSNVARVPRTVRIGLLGLGVVGGGVARILREIGASLFAQRRVDLEVVAIAVAHPDKGRSVEVPRRLLTTDTMTVATDPSIDLIIEVIGGAEPAASLLRAAIDTGHDVVTANKLVLAPELPAWHRLARANGVRLLYEAAVCGSVPVLRSIDLLRQTDVVEGITGIVNGSTNYILTAMSERGWEYDEALTAARAAGFLEADATLDISGADAAQKLSILIFHAFGEHVPPSAIATTGIEKIGANDIERARGEGKMLRLVARAVRDATTGSISASVRPEALDAHGVFAATRNEFNVIELTTRFAGPQLLRGKGAGSLPTASAVVSDVIEIVS